MTTTSSFRAARLKRGGGLREYAVKLGMEPGQLSLFERGLAGVSAERLFRIAELYGIDPGELETAWRCRDCDPPHEVAS